MSSYGEYLDIQLTEPVACEEIKDRCNQALPSGIEILKVRELKEGEKKLCVGYCSSRLQSLS